MLNIKMNKTIDVYIKGKHIYCSLSIIYCKLNYQIIKINVFNHKYCSNGTLFISFDHYDSTYFYHFNTNSVYSDKGGMGVYTHLHNAKCALYVINVHFCLYVILN